MEQFSRVFRHMPKYQVIICKECQFAVPPSQIKPHLAKHHESILARARREVADVAWNLNLLAQVGEDVIYPELSDAAVEGLPLYNDGLRCVSKDELGRPGQYVCRTIRGIQEHCKREHGWVDSQKRGRNSGAKKSIARTGCGRKGRVVSGFHRQHVEGVFSGYAARVSTAGSRSDPRAWQGGVG